VAPKVSEEEGEGDGEMEREEVEEGRKEEGRSGHPSPLAQYLQPEQLSEKQNENLPKKMR
jgi:hypothetical protein